MQPTAEILMATYNGARFLREQLDSILSQDTQAWHLTVSDDGSTDETPAILDEYAARWPEKITRHVSGQRFGNARDHFFHLMNGCGAAYMLFCDQDDVWQPSKVRKTLAALQEAEGGDPSLPVLAFCDQVPTDAQLAPLAPSFVRYQQMYVEEVRWQALLFQNVITGCATGINAALARLCRRCTQQEKVLMHDWWAGLAAARFGRVVFVDEPLSCYRQHGGNVVGAKDVGSLGHILQRLTHPGHIRRVNLQKKEQAKVFLQSYKDALTPEDQAFLRRFGRRFSGPGFYWRSRRFIHGRFRLWAMMLLG